MSTFTVGSYLAARLEEIGVEHFFTVPGDFNLTLLDEIIANPNLRLVGCCNELNAGYAADGYARARGIGAVVLTFSVGSLSAVNAVAGAYAEDLPLILVSGGPNTEDAPANHRIHHTTGRPGDYAYVKEMLEPVTCDAVIVWRPEDAPALIDRAISNSLLNRKPVYIEIACNLASSPVPAPVPYASVETRPVSDSSMLQAAVDRALSFISERDRPVLLAGPKLRSHGALQAFRALAEAMGSAVAMMPDAKGLFPETHPQWIGTYWGTVSSPGCAEIVESSDGILAIGCVFTDYTTTGYSSLIKPENTLYAEPDRVLLTGSDFERVYLADFLTALAKRVKRKPESLEEFQRVRVEQPPKEPGDPEKPLESAAINKEVQDLISPKTTLIVETGDSWFNGIKTRLPEGAGFEIQMQYGSIGWSVGASLGYALGAPDRRVIAMIGDGSFQLTGQEVSTIIRNGVRPIVFLINNKGYTIEEEIHSGPYNLIKNWDYSAFVSAVNADDGDGLGLKAATGHELAQAVAKAKAHRGFSLIECIIHPDDCSKELLEWGSRVEAANSRPPRAA
ncbi:MAG: thiamine pyrophosphate-binding protein [Candidatus Aquicultorales bacterium]